MKEILAIALGGGIGAYLRHSITIFTKSHYKITCKNTLFINILGCFCFGASLALMNIIPNLFSNELKMFLTTGLIASFTTFSTFAYENVLLIQDKEYLKSFLYISLSLIFGILAIIAGYFSINII